MIVMVWCLLIVLCAGLVLELLSRIYYRLYYQLPFKPKIVGEYPFKEFTISESPPICFSFKKGFDSHNVNINRFGLLGPEPQADGSRKRILVIGESNIFGAKLLHEKDLWSIQLENMLTSNGHADHQLGREVPRSSSSIPALPRCGTCEWGGNDRLCRELVRGDRQTELVEPISSEAI